MTVEEFIRDITSQLTKAGVATARLDCLILLEDVLGRNRANILAHTDDVLPSPLLVKLNNFVTQRTHHVPLAYIRGRAAFYGRDFIVNQDVLVPRPETESMIEILKELPLTSPTIADIGCGSGCLGITAKLELPTSKVTLYDVSTAALDIAETNANALHADVLLKQQDLLHGLDQQLDVLLANLPYVPDTYPINEAAKHEPKLALFAGTDGLELYRRMFDQLDHLGPNKARYVLTEALTEQLDSLADIAKAAGYHEVQRSGLVQLFNL